MVEEKLGDSGCGQKEDKLLLNEHEAGKIRDHEKNVYACMVLGGLTSGKA